MFFLPAELVKKAGNEVLPHWMGDLGRSQDVSSSSVTESVFSFLAGQCNRFPILPPLASCCLELSEVCQHFGSFSPAIDSNSVIIVILTVVLIIKRAVALSCGRQNAFSVWEWRYPKLDYRGGGGGTLDFKRCVKAANTCTCINPLLTNKQNIKAWRKSEKKD